MNLFLQNKICSFIANKNLVILTLEILTHFCRLLRTSSTYIISPSNTSCVAKSVIVPHDWPLYFRFASTPSVEFSLYDAQAVTNELI